MFTAVQTPASSVLWLIDLATGPVWLDGGWGVDALIKRQTRAHEDVDIVIRESDATNLVTKLRRAGFVDVERDDTRPCNFVLGSELYGLVDFHLVRFDAEGNGIYGIPRPEGMYPAYAFKGRGTILDRHVNCMSAAYQIENHNSGYSLREKDFADMAALSDATGISLPKRLIGR